MVLSDAVTAGTDAALIKPGQTNILCEGGLFAINEPRLMGEVKALPAKSNGHITFGGTALLAHLSPSTVQMWADILHAVPGSKLHLGYVELASADVKERAAELFADAGLQDRITVWNTDYDQRKNPSYFNAIDIFLDTYPSNRPLDLCHSLWMGVPAISRQGDKRGAMMGASILNSAGQPEWIARSNDEFVSVAASLAADIDALAQIRARLRDDVKTSKLLDTVGYVRGLEAAFEKSLSSR